MFRTIRLNLNTLNAFSDFVNAWLGVLSSSFESHFGEFVVIEEKILNFQLYTYENS